MALVGSTNGIISNSYATGSVEGTEKTSLVGGMVADNEGQIANSYSVGKISGRPGGGGTVGGFLGTNDSDQVANSYWDTTTSKKKIGVGEGDSSGVTGLTTKELQSGLPAGFDPTIWAEDKKINNGYPYLINNPPPK